MTNYFPQMPGRVNFLLLPPLPDMILFALHALPPDPPNGAYLQWVPEVAHQPGLKWDPVELAIP